MGWGSVPESLSLTPWAVIVLYVHSEAPSQNMNVAVVWAGQTKRTKTTLEVSVLNTQQSQHLSSAA